MYSFANVVCKMAAILFGPQLHFDVIWSNNYIDVTRVSWRLKSPASQLFLIASSNWQQRKYQGTTFLAFVREIHGPSKGSPHKGVSHAESVSMSTAWPAASPHSPSPMRMASPGILFPYGKPEHVHLKTEHCHDVNFVGTGRTGHCRLRQPLVRQSWHRDDSHFSLVNAKFLVKEK